MTPKLAPLGVLAYDQAGTATAVWSTAPTTSQGKLPANPDYYSVGCLQFGNITGNTFTLAVTVDGVSRSPLMVTDAGVIIASAGTGTATDGLKVYFLIPVGTTAVTATSTAGSGNVQLVLMSDAAEMNAAYLKALMVTGVSASLASGTKVGIAYDSTLWAETHVPAENVVATKTKSAPGAGTRLVVTGFSGLIATDNAAPTAGSRLLTLTEDVGGTPVVLWNGYVGIPATAGALSGITVECNIPVTANKTVTLAFASAGGTDTLETVNMNGRVETVA